MTTDQPDFAAASKGLDAIDELATELGEDSPVLADIRAGYLSLGRNAMQPHAKPAPPADTGPQPLAPRPGWMDCEGRVGVGLDDEQRQAEKVHQRETDDREEAILNHIQDGEIEAAARLGGKPNTRCNLQG